MPLREIFAAYAGGIGLNSFLPAQAGTIAYLGMYRAIIVNSRMVTIVAGGIAQNLFYASPSSARWSTSTCSPAVRAPRTRPAAN